MSREFCDHLLDLLRPRYIASARRMFDGHGLFAGGLMFAIVFDETLYLKTDAENRPAFEAAGMRPFCYSSRGKTVTLSYWEAPPGLLEEPDELQSWAGQAIAAALRAGKNKKKRQGKPKK